METDSSLPESDRAGCAPGDFPETHAGALKPQSGRLCCDNCCRAWNGPPEERSGDPFQRLTRGGDPSNNLRSTTNRERLLRDAPAPRAALGTGRAVEPAAPPDEPFERPVADPGGGRDRRREVQVFNTLSLCLALTALSPALGDSIPAGSAEVIPGPDVAQAAEPAVVLAPGARVRITRPSPGGRPLIGQIVSVSRDSLRVRLNESGGVTTFRMDDKTLVERNAEHHTHAVAGAVTGGLLGGLVGLSIVSYEQSVNDLGESIGGVFGAPPPVHNEVSSAPIYLGLVLGGVLGGLIGNAINSDNWVPASVPVHVALRESYDPAGGFRVALAFSARRSP